MVGLSAELSYGKAGETLLGFTPASIILSNWGGSLSIWTER